MSFNQCSITVRQLPGNLNNKSGQSFLADLEHSMHAARPCIVLDCSKVAQLDRTAIHVLLCCLEEAMKCNGDVKLAAVSAVVKSELKLSGIDRLFEFYETVAEAVGSSRRQSPEAASHAKAVAAPLPAGNAA